MSQQHSSRRSELPAGVVLRGALPAGAGEVLSPEALGFVAELVRRFRPEVERLLGRRRELQRRLDAGERPGFLPATAELRAAAWTVAPPPADLRDRRVELTGPADARTIARGLASGADAFVADLEDATSPTWRNVVEGQVSLARAVAGTLPPVAPAVGAASPGGPAVLLVRPRGWHLAERHLLVDGAPAPAALLDFGLACWNLGPGLVARGSGLYLYLPKLEGHLEARLWSEVFRLAEERRGLPAGAVRATVLVETLPAVFELDELLWELRERAVGLAFGPSGLAFSAAKRLRADPRRVFPGRHLVGREDGFLRACALLLVRTAHRRGVPAAGGLVAQLSIEDDPAAHEVALARVRRELSRALADGHDVARVVDPALVPVARATLERPAAAPDARAPERGDVAVSAEDLLRVPSGARTEAGLRRNVRVSLRYLEAWLRGQGAVPLYHQREDAGTVELSRAIAWQWIHHGVVLDDAAPLTVERFRTVLAEELDRVRLEVGDARFEAGRFEDARALFERLCTQPEFVEFITLPAYELLEASDEEKAMILSGSTPTPETSPAPHHPDPRRWEGTVRRYGKAEVERLRGSVKIEHTLARMGAERLWELLHTEPYVAALGALTGNQAVQMVKAGLKAIYLSGWQVAADANTAGQTYPDQSLYPADSVPAVVRRINSAFQRVDQIEHAEGRSGTHWFAPIVADAEAGFGGPLNAFELMKAMIEAGAAGVHFEDQVASEKKCGHLGGKVLVPTSTFVRTLTAARLAADVMDVPTIVVARTDAESASLIMSDVDPLDAPFVDRSSRTAEGFYGFRGGVEAAIARGVAYAPHADVVWCETQTPDLEFARRFAEAIHAKHPGKLLAYNCSPSFNWKKHLDDATIARFQRELGAMGYKFQFVTLAGFHALNHSMFQLARGYRDRGMAAYSELQQGEFAAEKHGYTATRHQREVGVGYFDQVATVISGGQSSTLALEGSTEAAQFEAGHGHAPANGHAHGKNGSTHPAAHIQAALDEDHGRLETIIGRLAAANDGTALAATLDELLRVLTEHFAHEEHAKGFYGVLGARSDHDRAEVARMIEEHREMLAALKTLSESAKAVHGPQDAMRRCADLAARLIEHEGREMRLARELV